MAIGRHGVTECVWITGASSGIGRAVALELARAGRLVVASARRAEALDELAQEAAGLPGTIHGLPLDVTVASDVAAAVAHIEAEIAPIGTAILGAGTYRHDSAETISARDLDVVMRLNLLGVIHALEALVPRMVGRGGGHLVAVASLAAYRGLPHAAAYGASKAALITYCEALRPQLKRKGIIVQVVNPGFVRTPLTDRNDFPMPFLMDVDAAARALVRGLGSKRFEIVFPRRFAYLMKLLRIAPYWLYFRITRRMVRDT